eukprot:XP_001710018.1 Hypothetical protein GL50803_35031 [Giardia lamblia ATCC 50803]
MDQEPPPEGCEVNVVLHICVLQGLFGPIIRSMQLCVPANPGALQVIPLNYLSRSGEKVWYDNKMLTMLGGPMWR